MTTENHFIAREGWIYMLITLIPAVFATLFLNEVYLILTWFLFLFVAYFFRNPKRETPTEGLISPADGKIIFVGQDTEHDFLKTQMQRVTIFMSPADVHVNRLPESGTIVNSIHHFGKFLAAFDERASTENERWAHHLKTVQGDDIVFTQIAGWFARRIVSYMQPGESWSRGKIFGLIKFGSRMDVFLPAHYDLAVTLNQRVKAGETLLAKRKN